MTHDLSPLPPSRVQSAIRPVLWLLDQAGDPGRVATTNAGVEAEACGWKVCMKKLDMDSKKWHEANAIRARQECAGPSLRSALEPVLRQVPAAPILDTIIKLTVEECAAVIEACGKADF